MEYRILTSYFRKWSICKNKMPEPISVALSKPIGMEMKEMPLLMPTKQMLFQYKKGILTDKMYREEFLRELDRRFPKGPSRLLELLPPECVLLCWEAKGKFCHRHIIAEWLSPIVVVKEFSDTPYGQDPGRFHYTPDAQTRCKYHRIPKKGGKI